MNFQFYVNYTVLDVKYNKEEYQLLMDKLTVLFPIPALAPTINSYLFGKKILLRSNMTDYNSLSKWVEDFDREYYRMMYRRPLYEMPLFINTEYVRGAIVTWRLEIGK